MQISVEPGGTSCLFLLALVGLDPGSSGHQSVSRDFPLALDAPHIGFISCPQGERGAFCIFHVVMGLHIRAALCGVAIDGAARTTNAMPNCLTRRLLIFGMVLSGDVRIMDHLL